MKYLLILILVFVSNCTQKKTAKETLPFLNVVPLQTDLGANPIQQLMGNSLEVYEAKFELDYPALGFVTETLYEINLESPISIAESFLFVRSGSPNMACSNVSSKIQSHDIGCLSYYEQFKPLKMGDPSLIEVLSNSNHEGGQLTSFVLSFDSDDGDEVSEISATDLVHVNFYSAQALYIEDMERLYLPEPNGMIHMPAEGTKIYGFWDYFSHSSAWLADPTQPEKAGIVWKDPANTTETSITNTEGVDPLNYRFVLNEPTCVTVKARTRHSPPSGANDLENDVFVRTDEHTTWRKAYASWLNNFFCDFAFAHTHVTVNYCFNSGGEHRIEISGRSNNFEIDQFQVAEINGFPGGNPSSCSSFVESASRYLFVPEL